MAIVIEGEKKNIDWGFILGILLSVSIIVSAIIYIFFVNPATVQQLITPEQRRLSEFSKAKVSPGEILSSPEFQNLKIAAPITSPSEFEVGKDNPFLP